MNDACVSKHVLNYAWSSRTQPRIKCDQHIEADEDLKPKIPVVYERGDILLTGVPMFNIPLPQYDQIGPQCLFQHLCQYFFATCRVRN